MAKATLADRIEHIQRSLKIIEGYWRVKTISDFEAADSEALHSATERHLLIIAEATKFIPDVVTADFPQIQWREIVGIGNILRHAYEAIDGKRIWDVVQLDLPRLGLAIDAIAQKS